MATKFTAGTVINAGLIVVGVDADAPPATPSPAPESTNIALTATSTASTHISDRPPSLAHDGIIGISDTDGSTISGLNAWVTTGERVGAWMQLDWSTPQTVNKIKLYDRPNVTHDHIKGGTLTFSDGSSVTVGELPDGVVNGAPDPLEVTFDAKTITWVRFTVDAFTGHNAGLTEFEVFGYEYQAPAPEPAPESAPEPITINNSRLVSLLLDASVDADGSVVDGSTNSHAITVNGDVTQSSFSPYRSGGYSWEFDGSGDYLTVGDANLLDITSATQSFTVEAWVNPASRSVGGAGYRFSSIVSKGVVYVSFGITDTGALQFYTYNGGFNYITSTAGDIALNEWQHVAVVCDSGSITLYKNGTSIATGSLVVPTGGTNVVPKIGAADPAYASDFFDGKMADLRIMDGTVTAPTAAPTERLTEVAGTSLLTCNLPYLQSGLTAHGDVSPVAAGPYDYAGYSESLHGGSIVFGNADGNSLSMTGSADFQLDADFTLESWVNITDNGKWQPLAMWGNGHYKAIRIAGRNTSITEINIEYPNSYVFVTHPTPVHGTGWHHIAIVRSGSTITLYVDGVAGNTVTLSNTIGTTEDFKVGYHTTGGGNHWVDGSFADYRLVKGTAVYTEDFTPPTAPLEAVTGTSLLLSGNNAAIRDESQSVESISVFGNTTVADSSPYGTGKSMSFDGNGDYLSIDLGDNLIDSNTPFTVEFWMYPENISNRGILHFTNNPGTLEATLYISGAGNLSWFDSRVGSAAAGDITPNSGGGITTNEWHHIALTRQSDNYVKIYVDGQLYNVSSSVWDLGLSRYLEVGRYANTAYFDGYVSDLRIIEGTAIYTENFSVPTAPLGDYSESTPSPAPEPAPAAPAELVGEPSVSSFSHIPSTRYATPGSPAVTDAATGVDVGRPDTGSSASAMIDVTVEVGVEYEFSFTATTQSGDTMFMGVIPSQGATTPEFGYVGDNALGQYPNTVHNRASVSGSGDSQTIVFTATQTDLQIVMWNSYSENLVNVQFISLKATS